MRKKRINYTKLIKAFNKEKGYGVSVKKAVEKAIEEEGATKTFLTKDNVLLSFLVYSLTKSYIRFYNFFTRDIYFRKGKFKFLIYSLDVFVQAEGKEAFEDIKNSLKVVNYGRRTDTNKA